VLLKIEGDGAFEVDMRVRDRSDVAHMALGAVPVCPACRLIVLIGIPGDDSICEQRESTGDCGHLLARPAATRRDLACVDGALQCVHGFDLAEKSLDFLPEGRSSEIVTQEYRSFELSQGFTRIVNRHADRRRAVPLNRPDGAAPSGLRRRGESQQPVPAKCKRPSRQGSRDDRFEHFRNFGVLEDLELSIRQSCQTRADIEAQKLAQPHREMGHTMGIDGDFFEAPVVVA
jgi:hypothetical protein